MYLPTSHSEIREKPPIPHLSYLSYSTASSLPPRRKHFPKVFLIISLLFNLDT